jgi:hypothetical protein
MLLLFTGFIRSRLVVRSTCAWKHENCDGAALSFLHVVRGCHCENGPKYGPDPLAFGISCHFQSSLQIISGNISFWCSIGFIAAACLR